jgi:hypothetical protein
MIRWCLAMLIMLASPVAADDFCGMADDLSGAKARSLARSLAGEWQGFRRGGHILGADGIMRRLPPADEVQQVSLTARRGILYLAEGVLFDAATLAPAPETPSLALPREVGVSATALLAPELAAAGLDCAVESLPHYQARVTGVMAETYHLFALSPDAMAMVVMAAGDGQVVRVIVDLYRR